MRTALLAFLLLLAPLARAAVPISFGQLPAGDTLHVSFTSRGCFHHHAYEFDFRRGQVLTVHVTRLEPRWNEARQRREPSGRMVLGGLILSAAEVTGLDRLLTFYRSRRGGGCTTRERVALTLHPATDTRSVKETYKDDPCGSFQRTDLTTFESLVARLQPAPKRL